MVDKAPPQRVRIGSCLFDPARAELLGPDGAPVHLRPRAMRLLEVLLAQAGRVVTRDDLIAAVWPGVVVTDDSLVQCVGDIRRALGADHGLLHTLPRLGYRLDLPPPDPPPPDPQPPISPTSPTSPASAWHAGWRPWAGAGAAVLIATLVWLMADGGDPIEAALSGRSAPAAGRPIALLVRVVPDPAGAVGKEEQAQAAAFAAGMAEQLAADLARNTDLVPVAVPAHESAPPAADLARRLATRFIADGRVRRQPTGWQLTLRLIAGSKATVLWTDLRESTPAGQRADREALLRRIAQGTGASMRLADGAVALPAAPASIEVFERVMRALARVRRYDRDEYRIAHDELQQAIEREPGYALAWAVQAHLDALHASARLSGELSDARRAELVAEADRALALDPGLLLAQQARVLALVGAGRAADAVRAAEATLKIAALDAHNHWGMANALVADGRMAEALQAMALAQSREPAAPVTPAEFDFVRAKVLWGNDRFDEAVEAASRCLEKVPQFAACRAIRALSSDGMGRLETAREDLKAYRVVVPGPPTPTLGPGSYGVPKLQNNWLADVRTEIGLP